MSAAQPNHPLPHRHLPISAGLPVRDLDPPDGLDRTERGTRVRPTGRVPFGAVIWIAIAVFVGVPFAAAVHDSASSSTPAGPSGDGSGPYAARSDDEPGQRSAISADGIPQVEASDGPRTPVADSPIIPLIAAPTGPVKERPKAADLAPLAGGAARVQTASRPPAAIGRSGAEQAPPLPPALDRAFRRALANPPGAVSVDPNR